jgi:hypothetical protein
MKRVMIAATALCVAVGCDKAGEGGKDQAKVAGSASASAQATKPAAPSRSFAGTYRSSWGDTVFTEAGDTVSATYPGGTLSCAVKDGALDCTWNEGGATGKAHLTRLPNGNIEGTWGNAVNDRGGGQWTFEPKK